MDIHEDAANQSSRRKPKQLTEALAEQFFDRMVLSDRGLEQLCAAPDMPSLSTVRGWVRNEPDFRAGFRAAREIQGAIQADRALCEALDADDAGLGRLRFAARTWMASKLAPAQFGSRLSIEHNVATSAPAEADDLKAAAKLASLLDLARIRRDEAEGRNMVMISETEDREPCP